MNPNLIQFTTAPNDLLLKKYWEFGGLDQKALDNLRLQSPLVYLYEQEIRL